MMKLSEDLKQSYIQVAMVAAILADHYSEGLYKEVQKNNSGYITTMELFGQWAYEFEAGTTHINWEDAISDGQIAFKVDINTYWQLEGVCWDDFIIEFGKEKLNQYRNG